MDINDNKDKEEVLKTELIETIPKETLISGTDYDEVPKYRKKKVKKNTKSNHKHDYEEVLVKISEPWGDMFVLADRCRDCGKLKYTQMFFSEKEEGSPYSRMLSNEEIFEKYKHLPLVEKEKL